VSRLETGKISSVGGIWSSTAEKVGMNGGKVSGYSMSAEVQEQQFYGLRFNLFDYRYVNDAIKFKLGGFMNATEGIGNSTETVNITKEVLFASEFAHILDSGNIS
jgi:hypothetical protein